jgi:hypothetical protein
MFENVKKPMRRVKKFIEEKVKTKEAKMILVAI